VYIDSKSPKMHSRSINTRSMMLLLHPINYYMHRPIEFEHYIFTDYCKAYKVVKTKYAKKIVLRRDEFGIYL